MKRIISIFLLTGILPACNNESNTEIAVDTTALAIPVIDTPGYIKDSNSVQTDTSVLDTSRIILQALKEMNVEKLSQYIHPALRLRFSPYAFIDTTSTPAFTPYQLKMAFQKSSVFHWGSYDGSGDPIRGSIQEYFKKFVYNEDYLNAPQQSVNNFLVGGNSLNNMQEIYPNSIFTEFYFPGFDEKYQGMDWESLRLVFQSVQGRLYLVAIVHDHWTI